MLMQEHVQNVYGDARILRLRSGQALAGMTKSELSLLIIIHRGQTRRLFRGLLAGVYALRRNEQQHGMRTSHKCSNPAIESCGS